MSPQSKSPAVRPILFTPTDGRGTPETEAETTPTDRKATELDAFAADMRRSLEQPEERPATEGRGVCSSVEYIGGKQGYNSTQGLIAI